MGLCIVAGITHGVCVVARLVVAWITYKIMFCDRDNPWDYVLLQGLRMTYVVVGIIYQIMCCCKVYPWDVLLPVLLMRCVVTGVIH